MDLHPKARVRLVDKPNGGLADARNVGLTFARGSWLCMLDSDDLLGRDYLLRAAALIRGAAPPVLCCSCAPAFAPASGCCVTALGAM